MPLDIQYMYYIPLITLFLGLFIDIKHKNNIKKRLNGLCLKFSIHVDEGQLEGSVSQIIYLGPGSKFMKSRKKKF